MPQHEGLIRNPSAGLILNFPQSYQTAGKLVTSISATLRGWPRLNQARVAKSEESD
jgi:hypothetical protein